MFGLRRLWLLLRGGGRELLVLMHAFRHPATPLPIKVATVLLGLYLVSPVDAISDLLPILGWADDVALLAIVVPWLVKRLPPDVRLQAQGRAAGTMGRFGRR